MNTRWSPLALGLSLLIGTSSIAWAQQDEDALWAAYADAADAYADATERLEEYDVTTTQGDRLHRQAAARAAELFHAVQSLLDADVPLDEDEREALVDTLLTARQVEGTLRIDVGDCEEGRTLLTSVLSHPEIDGRPLVAARAEQWIARADACLDVSDPVASSVPIGTSLSPPAEDRPSDVWAEAPPASSSSAARTTGIVLASTGAAMLVSAVAWDISMMDDVDQFRTLNASCASLDRSGCDSNELLRLRDRIDDAKLPIGALYGVGAAAAITGVVLWIVHRDRGSETGVIATPSVGWGYVGADVHFRF
jgi:hypothetical protein